MNKILAAAAALALVAGAAQAQTRAGDRSADALNAQVLAVLNANRTPAPAPVAAAPTGVAALEADLRGVYVGGNVGTNFRDQSGVSLGMAAGYQFNRYLGAEVTYDYNNTSFANNGQMVMGNVVGSYRIGQTAFTPYALAGAGVGWNAFGSRTNATAGSNGSNLGLYNVGAGVRVNMTRNLDLDVRYRYVGAWDSASGYNQNLTTVGINWRF